VIKNFQEVPRIEKSWETLIWPITNIEEILFCRNLKFCNILWSSDFDSRQFYKCLKKLCPLFYLFHFFLKLLIEKFSLFDFFGPGNPVTERELVSVIKYELIQTIEFEVNCCDVLQLTISRQTLIVRITLINKNN